MTTELVLLLGIYAFVLLTALFGDNGPIATFKKSGPRLGARIERNIAVGNGFRQKAADNQPVNWVKPEGGNQ